MTPKYFIYTHTLDGVVFYVGCGKIRTYRTWHTFKGDHERAFAFAKRRQNWKDYVNGRQSEIVIKIIEDGIECKRLALEREKYYISKYGRIDLGTGTLVNRAGTGGCPIIRCIEVEQLDLCGNVVRVWNSVRQIQSETGFLKTNIVKCCRKKQITAYGFTWRYKNIRSFDAIKATTSRKKLSESRLNDKRA